MQVTNLAHYPVINKPITTDAAIVDLLMYSAFATNDVGHKYIIFWCDLGVYNKVMAIIWSNVTEYLDFKMFLSSAAKSKITSMNYP